jgi:hypothetical protein
MPSHPLGVGERGRVPTSTVLLHAPRDDVYCASCNWPDRVGNDRPDDRVGGSCLGRRSGWSGCPSGSRVDRSPSGSHLGHNIAKDHIRQGFDWKNSLVNDYPILQECDDCPHLDDIDVAGQGFEVALAFSGL